MELYQKQTLKLATKSDPKEKVKENKKIKNQLADSISIKEAIENANKKIDIKNLSIKFSIKWQHY